MSKILAAGLALAAAFTAAPAFAQDFDPMQFADTNQDGKVTLEEFTAFQTQGWQFVTQDAAQVKPAELEGPAKGLVAGIPTDANGVVTKEAFIAYIPTRFKATDTNGDGTIDAAELKASMGMPAQ